jgi:hypothetical protein
MTAALALVPPPFDYSAMDVELAANLRKQAARIRKRIGKATQDLIDIGRDLTAAKKQLVDHGEFIEWVETEVGISRRTAQAYMAVARLADDKGAAIALLPPTTVHRLAAKSAPAEVVSEVIAKAESGDVLPDRTVSEMILEAKSQRKQPAQDENHSDRRSKQSRNGYDTLESARQENELRNQKIEMAETAETLLKAIGVDGVTLVVKIFSEEECLWDLLYVLRRRIGVGADIQEGRREAVH